MNASNVHELILGAAGSGKSYELKEKIKKTYQEHPEDLIVLLDLEGEFSSEEFGISDIHRIALGNGSVYNLMEHTEPRDSALSSVAEKSEFMYAFLSSLQGGFISERAAIERSVRRLYSKEDTKYTLKNFYEELLNDNTPEGNKLAMMLEVYVFGTGSDLFNGLSTVGINKEDTMLILQGTSYTLNKAIAFLYLEMIQNYANSAKRGERKMHLYINNSDHLFKEDFFANFVKRARMLGITITMTAQSFMDIVENRPGCTVVNNIGRITMFNMCKPDIAALQNYIDLPDNLCGVISNQKPGIGLVYDGQTFTPFNYNK